MWIDLTIRCIDQLKKIMLIILLTTRYSPCLRKCDLHLTSKNYLKKKLKFSFSQTKSCLTQIKIMLSLKFIRVQVILFLGEVVRRYHKLGIYFCCGNNKKTGGRFASTSRHAAPGQVGFGERGTREESQETPGWEVKRWRKRRLLKIPCG